MGQKLKTILLSVGIVLVGFLREYLFYNINWIYLTLVNGRRNAAMKEFYFLLEWSPAEINILKTFLTLLFIVIFCVWSMLILRSAFGSKKHDGIILFTFIAISSVALILAGIGYISGTYSSLYGIIRTLIGIAQSFIPVMILGILIRFLASPKEPNEKKVRSSSGDSSL